MRTREAGSPAIAAQILYYGSCDYPSSETPASREFADGPVLSADDLAYFWELYLHDPQTEQHDPIASPMRAANHRNLPPAFVGTAEIDPSRDHGEAYVARLEAAGAHARTVRYPGMIHGFISWLGLIPAAQTAIDDACEFLAAQW